MVDRERPGTTGAKRCTSLAATPCGSTTATNTCGFPHHSAGVRVWRGMVQMVRRRRWKSLLECHVEHGTYDEDAGIGASERTAAMRASTTAAARRAFATVSGIRPCPPLHGRAVCGVRSSHSAPTPTVRSTSRDRHRYRADTVMRPGPSSTNGATVRPWGAAAAGIDPAPPPRAAVT